MGGTGKGVRGERAEPAGVLCRARDWPEQLTLLAPTATGGSTRRWSDVRDPTDAGAGVRRQAVAPGSGLTLVVGKGVRIEISPEFDAVTLERVLATLEAVA